MHYNDKSRNKAEGELSMDQTQMSNSAPLVTIVHASVGSGHKAAANAIAQAFDLIRGTKGIPEDIEIEVLDILDFGRIKFDGNKTAASFTGATRPIYDLTWRYTLTGHLLWHGMVAYYVPRLQRIYSSPQAYSRGRNAHHSSQCCRGRPRNYGYRLPGHLCADRLRSRRLLAPQGHRPILCSQRVYGRNAAPASGARAAHPHHRHPHARGFPRKL